MFSIGSIFTPSRPAQARYDLALRRRPDPTPPREAPSRDKAADDHIYFSVRSLGFSGARHLLQYAFADDRGNVVLSTVSAAQRLSSGTGQEPPDDLAVEPLEPEDLSALVGRVCEGASLVTFGRVLQSGLLPARAVQSAYSVDCAWRRFLRVSRQRRIAFDRHEPVTLADALSVAGLRPLESADAAMRALAIRDLWAWMDKVELRTGWA